MGRNEMVAFTDMYTVHHTMLPHHTQGRMCMLVSQYILFCTCAYPQAASLENKPCQSIGK
jgi:hypothetical protein